MDLYAVDMRTGNIEFFTQSTESDTHRISPEGFQYPKFGDYLYFESELHAVKKSIEIFESRKANLTKEMLSVDARLADLFMRKGACIVRSNSQEKQ
jgi:hypothetical protein